MRYTLVSSSFEAFKKDLMRHRMETTIPPTGS